MNEQASEITFVFNSASRNPSKKKKQAQFYIFLLVELPNFFLLLLLIIVISQIKLHFFLTQHN